MSLAPALLAVPIFLLLVPARVQAQAPADAEHRRVMKADLRSLVAAQEAFFAARGGYTSQVGNLVQFQPSPAVTVTIDAVIFRGWRATAHRSGTSITCSVFVGSSATPGAIEGQPFCTGEPLPNAGAVAMLEGYRADVRALMVAQNRFYSERARYAASLTELGFRPASVDTVFLNLTPGGWSGFAVRLAVRDTACAVFVGEVPPELPGVPVNQPVCTGDAAFAMVQQLLANGSQQELQAAMQAELRRLVAAEEAYWKGHSRYTESLEALGFGAPEGLTIAIQRTADGWLATARHAATTALCAIYIGSPPPGVSGISEGTPWCGGGTESARADGFATLMGEARAAIEVIPGDSSRALDPQWVARADSLLRAAGSASNTATSVEVGQLYYALGTKLVTRRAPADAAITAFQNAINLDPRGEITAETNLALAYAYLLKLVQFDAPGANREGDCPRLGAHVEAAALGRAAAAKAESFDPTDARSLQERFSATEKMLRESMQLNRCRP